MTSPTRVGYMFLVAFSAVMIGISLVYLTGFIAGGFVGLWFAVLIFSGAQVMLVDRQRFTSEQIQQQYRKRLSGTSTTRSRRRARRRREIL